MGHLQDEVKSLIPHRAPFLFVDAIEQADQKQITGSFHYRPEEAFFAGHFPEFPVVPGVLLIEALAQCGGAGLRKAGLLGDRALFFLASVEKARFRQPVRPGMTVKFIIINERVGSRLFCQSGQVFYQEQLMAEASWRAVIDSRAQGGTA